MSSTRLPLASWVTVLPCAVTASKPTMLRTSPASGSESLASRSATAITETLLSSVTVTASGLATGGAFNNDAIPARSIPAPSQNSIRLTPSVWINQLVIVTESDVPMTATIKSSPLREASTSAIVRSLPMNSVSLPCQSSITSAPSPRRNT